MTDYFSDRENGPVPCTQQVISNEVWQGLTAIIRGLINSGALGYKFPENCPDGSVVCGVDEESFNATVRAEVPGLQWPPANNHGPSWRQVDTGTPDTLQILDLVELLHNSVAQPVLIQHHSYLKHNHLTFRRDEGQESFRADVNRLFARNGVAYILNYHGQVERVLPPVIDEALTRTLFRTGDTILDNALDESRRKFTSPDALVRREALERLWDCWERMKTLLHSDKRQSVTMLLDRATQVVELRQVLEDEARALTTIGNSHLIRHFEVSQVPVIDSDFVDYLFHRLFALIHLLLKKL